MTVQIVTLSAGNYKDVIREPSPEMPSLETLLWQDGKCSPETIMLRVAAVNSGGRMVGFGMAVAGPWDPILRPGYFDITVQVEPEWTNRGIGSGILERLERFAYEHGAIALQSHVSERRPGDLNWAESRGFAKTQHVFESELDLSGFNADLFADVLSAVEESGLQFASLAEWPGEEERFARFADFWWEIAKDVPGMSGISCDRGRWAAMSYVLRQSESVYYNNLTGVLPEYRGRGLAMAVKVKSAEYARQRGAAFLRTHNDSNNERMLAVNRKMGYQPKPGIFFLVRSGKPH